jgi:hypothetical protein
MIGPTPKAALAAVRKHAGSPRTALAQGSTQVLTSARA